MESTIPLLQALRQASTVDPLLLFEKRRRDCALADAPLWLSIAHLQAQGYWHWPWPGVTERISMSMEALKQFHALARPGTDLEAEVNKALLVGPAEVAALGARHGFSFTATDVTDLIAEYSAGRELADDQLELVSGGGGPTCNPPADQGDMKR